MIRFASAILAGSALALAACSQEPADTAPETEMTEAPAEGSAADMSPNMNDIVEAASAAGGYETFLQAALSAKLAEQLATTQGLTVFAPTDDAFAAVPNIAELQNNPEQLANVLRVHVVPKEYMSSQIPEGETQVETLGGATLTITKNADGVTVTGPSGTTATVTQADIDGDNGVVHGIDAVLMP